MILRLISSVTFSITAGFLALASIPQTTQKQPITVVVLDSAKRPMYELAVDRIRIRGVSAAAVHSEPVSGPRHIVLLLDLSQSSRNSAIRWTNMINTCKEFLKEVQPADRIALHAFGQNHHVLVPLTHESSLVEHELDALFTEKDHVLRSAYGRATDVTAALQSTFASEKSSLRFGDVIVVVSDGEYWDMEAKRLQRHLNLIEAGIRVYLLRTAELVRSMRFTPTLPVEMTSRLELDALQRQERAQQELVVPVGGAVVSPGEPIHGYPDASDRPFKPERISGASRALGLLIRNAHKIDLEITEPVRKPRSITLEMLDPGDGKGGKMEVQYPHWVLPQGKTWN